MVTISPPFMPPFGGVELLKNLCFLKIVQTFLLFELVFARNTSKTVLKAFSECSAKLFGLPPLIAVFGGV